MSPGEKKIVGVLVAILVVMVGAYLVTGRSQQPAASPLQQAAALDPHAGHGHEQPQGGTAGQAQVFGEPGAALEIVALVPVANPCHAETIAQVKKAYEKHPKDIQLTVVEFMGPAAAEWRDKLGVTCATVSINGQHEFELKGRKVTLQRQEGGSYQPKDLLPIIEAELKKVQAAS